MSADLCNEIPDAMSNPENILVEELQGYQAIPSFFLYELYNGAFCQVYPLVKEGFPKRCLRLWTVQKLNWTMVKHVQNISLYFSLHPNPYVINYKYVERAFRLLDGTVLPGVVMDWVEGDSLTNFVIEHYRESSLMEQVAERFFLMVTYMNRNGMSHGDLSGDNIMVTKDHRLVLIDYDSFFIQGYESAFPQPTKGIADYQHPGRKTSTNCSGPKDDYFSHKVIYLSLLAIAKKPSIFNTNVDHGLLFKAEDMSSVATFRASVAYRNISGIADDKVRFYLRELEGDMNRSLEEVGPLLTYAPSLSSEDTLLSKIQSSRLVGTPLPAKSLKQKASLQRKSPVNAVGYADYCITCGYHFTDRNDRFCSRCGKERQLMDFK